MNERGGDSIKTFCRFFRVTEPKIFVGEPFSAVFQKSSGSEKIIDKRGRWENIKIFLRKFPVSQCQNFSPRNPSVVGLKKFPVMKKFMDKSGRGRKSGFSFKSFLSHSVKKIRRGTLLCWVSENFR